MDKTTAGRQWQLLKIYNFFRLFCILIFLIIFLYIPALNKQTWLYVIVILIYLLSSLVCLFCAEIKKPVFEKQVLLFGSADILFLSALISFIADMQSSFVILLNVNVAALSILVPGALVLFFAALSSALLLLISFIEYSYSHQSPAFTIFYSSGLHGISIFATAIAVWFLAHRVRISESIAYKRGTALASMQKINEYIIERLHSGVIYVDLNRHIYFINSAAKRFFNIEATQDIIQLKQLSRLLDKKCQQFLRKNPQEGEPLQTVIASPHLRVHFLASLAEIQPAVLIFLDDLSAVAQQAQQLKLSSLGRLSASIAHELRNPLGAIAHAVQLMGEADTLNQEDARMKQLIINNCNRMNGVIKNVLQLSRREAAKPQVIEFNSFILHFINDFCVYNQCKIEIEKPALTAINFTFDRSQLEQILVILCENAIQHSHVEGVPKITINITQSNLKTNISIRDEGEGIPTRLHEAIFEPFFSTKRTGFGMGLYIAKELCEINQARLVLVPEQGGCFVIVIEQPIGSL